MSDINPDTIADEFGILSLGVEDGVPTLTTTPTTEQARELVLAMSLACGKMLDDDQAPNYVEFEVSPAGKHDQPAYVVHVRRADGPSPHTLRKEADARVAELEALNGELGQRVNELTAQRNPEDEVLVEGSWFHPADLPKILGNFMRASDRYASEAKNEHVANEQLREHLAAAEQERDLAIAHDRQSYPTAWAYEQACAALEKHRQRADAAETRIAELERQLREEGNLAGRLTDQLRTACAAGVDARARVDELEKFAADLAVHGLRCDLNPTLLGDGTYEWWSDYLHTADKAIRDRARALLSTGDANA
ncbi:hypothetical protein [Nocardia aurea]|uniref:hypothetical protein n=1 Tax=Nocardia aurea TaxID=2144174 RepID=UPI0033AC9CD5